MTRSPAAELKARYRRAGARIARAGWVLLAVLACAGCATPAPVHLYTLMPAERPTPVSAAMPGGGPEIILEPVKIPAQVDQPQWLLRRADGSFVLLEQERWAAPLQDELHQALVEILTQRFGAVEARSGSTGPRWRIRVDITRFESLPNEARLESTWTLTPQGAAAPALRCTSYLHEAAEGGLATLAAAHRRAVARLGDEIGEQLLALQRGERGRCPA